MDLKLWNLAALVDIHNPTLKLPSVLLLSMMVLVIRWVAAHHSALSIFVEVWGLDRLHAVHVIYGLLGSSSASTSIYAEQAVLACKLWNWGWDTLDVVYLIDLLGIMRWHNIGGTHERVSSLYSIWHLLHAILIVVLVNLYVRTLILHELEHGRDRWNIEGISTDRVNVSDKWMVMVFHRNLIRAISFNFNINLIKDPSNFILNY